MTRIITERLVLRNLKMEDAQKIFDGWASDDEVTKYLTWDTHQSVETTCEILSNWIEAYQKTETVRFGIELKQTDELIGMIDVVNIENGYPEIGYVLAKKHWNHGYMTEALSKMTEYLFSLGYAKIIIKAEVNNIGSNTVIQKNGFEWIKQTQLNLPNEISESRLINVYEKMEESQYK